MTGRAGTGVKLTVIAREVGVSVSTVSKVINGRADVSAETRARVREALLRHGYSLAPSRASAARVNSALLDVVIHELDTAWSAALLSEVERAAAARGLNIVVSTVQTASTAQSALGPVPPRRWLDQVAARGTCGVLGILVDLTRAQLDYLADSGVPCIVIDPATRLEAPVATVHLSNRDSQYRLVEHLISLGHSDIAQVRGNPNSLPAQERTEGFEAAMADAGLRVRPEWMLEGGFDRDGSHEAMTALMTARERPTAVVFASDKGALGGMAAATRLGLKVPEDVSITGFDDIPDARSAVPPLTTVRQPVAAMVAEAMRRIVEPSAEGGRIVCEAEVVLRDSTAPPPR